jgi:peroxiredoxin
MKIATLAPRLKVPALSVPLAGGGMWTLAERTPANFSMIVFYRGLHCPICSRYLGDLEGKLDEFAKRGVDAAAISSDTGERAAEAKTKWKLPRLPIGYGLALDTALAWGLHLSAGRGVTSAGVEEPARFSEPGLFLARPDGTLYYGSTQTMPFARPPFADLLGALDFVIAKNYPARGEIVEI